MCIRDRLVSGNKIKSDETERFTENESKKGEIGMLEGAQVLDTVLNIIKSKN